MSTEITGGDQQVRSRILNTASELFYRQGIRAVGVDLVVEKAGVTKTSLYRYFNSKDDLIVAFLKLKDEEFWQCWDEITAAHANDPYGELKAQLIRIAEASAHSDFRGCPHLNTVTEFPDVDHPAHIFALGHKQELRRRLKLIVEKICSSSAEALSIQLAILINGACVTLASNPDEIEQLLVDAADALIAAQAAA